jgi:hypothetical protein
MFISSSRASPGRCATCQILITVLSWSVKRLTSFSSTKRGSPAKLFQTSTRRLAGHDAAASLNCGSVESATPEMPASFGCVSQVGVHREGVVRVDVVIGHVMFLGAIRMVPAHQDSSLRRGRSCKSFLAKRESLCGTRHVRNGAAAIPFSILATQEVQLRGPALLGANGPILRQRPELSDVANGKLAVVGKPHLNYYFLWKLCLQFQSAAVSARVRVTL